MNYTEYFNNVWNSPSRYSIIGIGIFILLYIPVMLFYLKRKKKKAADFLKENPTAAKVFIKTSMSGRLSVISVQGKPAVFFYEGTKQGFFLLPGENTVVFQYVWSRPGVLHKTVTTTVGPVSVKVTAETGKVYEISYDKEEKSCNFAEKG